MRGVSPEVSGPTPKLGGAGSRGGAASVTLRPGPAGWAGVAAAHFEQSRRDPAAEELRRELGLPGAAAVVMSGHQAELWHCGIAAKWLAMTATARALRARGVPAACAWVVVDQDANRPAEVPVPIRAGGALARGVWRLACADGSAASGESAAWGLPPLRATPTPDGCAAASGTASSIIDHFAGSENAAAQMGLAMREIMRGVDDEPVTLVHASALGRTRAMGEFAGRMARESAACVEAYNAAASAHPGAGVRALSATAGRTELPLWRLGAGGQRRRVFAETLTAGDGVLVPKALAMTGLLRSGACDLFIHGLGGERYERVTDAWLSAWLGASASAPVGVASATCFLPGLEGDQPPPTPEEIARAAWRAHHARHAPGLLGDDAAEASKRALAREASGPGGKARRAAAFAALQQMLGAWRAQRAGGLEAFGRERDAARARADESAIVYDRTWAAALFAGSREGAGVLRDLRASIDRAIA